MQSFQRKYYTTEGPKQLGRQPRRKQETNKGEPVGKNRPQAQTSRLGNKEKNFATQQQQEFQGSGVPTVPVAWLRINPGTSPSPNKVMRDKMVGDKAMGGEIMENKVMKGKQEDLGPDDARQ